MFYIILKEQLKTISCKFINGFGFGSGMATAFYLLRYHNINEKFNEKKNIN